ncbi:MAG TPA: DUF692 domain-containing protein [Verrucomicrobiae bacterium]|nr:DUF692 domain-containing protein [Verrucomicrobiae bacterium]
MIGIGYRKPLSFWIRSRPAGVECLEITAEHFYDEGGQELAALARDYHLFVHGLGLSLGTPGPLDKQRLEQFARVTKLANPDWISEHIAFTRTQEVDLGHLNPIPPTKESVKVIAGHAREISERCQKPIILENITSHLRLEGEFSETKFLNELCSEADCGLLLDVTNLFINSRNHNFDPLKWLQELEPARITQLHIVGYSFKNGRYMDSHAEAIQEELLDLARAVVEYAPVKAIILERDENFPEPAKMMAELSRLRLIFAEHGSHHRIGTTPA